MEIGQIEALCVRQALANSDGFDRGRTVSAEE